MAVKLHRCSAMWIKGPHPCWQVQKALDEQGIDYEVVRHPSFPRGRRKEYIQLTGQKLFPAIELEDGKVIREESKDMVARIGAGRLFEGAAGGSAGEHAAGGPMGEQSPGAPAGEHIAGGPMGEPSSPGEGGPADGSA